jgi:type IV pilus assembly protein PilA
MIQGDPMKKLHVRKGGFTLIELMIVVAIIGILAAIAIPNFLRFQLKAKSSEGKTNLAAIRTAEQSYYSEFGSYVSSQGAAPANTTTSSKVAFTPATAPGFGTIGWAPEGQVYFSYAVGSPAPGTVFFATAMADIDANATRQAWGYRTPGATVFSGGHTCAALASDNQVGPCDVTFGQSEF